MTRRHKIFWQIGSILVVCAILVAWHYLSAAGIFHRAFFPSPERTWAALKKGVANGYLVDELLTTIRRMGIGWVLASFVGIGLGAVVGLSATARTYLAPTLEAIRPLPSSALAPIAILAFGLTDQMILALVAFGALWPMLLTVVHGTSNVHPRKLEVARSLGFSRLEYAWKIALPSALPDILGGMRLGLTVALILAVVGEMITVQGGLGAHIMMASRRFNAADVFAGVVLLGAIGFTLSTTLSWVERRLLKWQPNYSKGGNL